MSGAIPVISGDIQTLLKYRISHMDFLRSCVFTLDQADKWKPIKPFPAHLPYMKAVADAIVNERLVAVVKHRRMTITWLVCALFLWDALFREGRYNALVSKKEEDSDELVQRCKFIYDNIPPDQLPVKPILEYKYTQVRFPEINSVIKGVPKGQDQLRQYTCSRIAADEMAFWPDGQITYSAMRPTIEGGGQIVLVSTRYPGFFQRLVEDQIEE